MQIELGPSTERHLAKFFDSPAWPSHSGTAQHHPSFLATHPFGERTMEPEHKFTKKQKKAQAFRANKGKGKKDESQADVPEEENLDLDLPEAVAVVGEKTKKRKRVLEEKEGEKEVAADAVVEGEGERKKKRQRGKKKSEQRAAEDGKPRLLLFAGASLRSLEGGGADSPPSFVQETSRSRSLSKLSKPTSSPAVRSPCCSSSPISTDSVLSGETPIVRLLTPKPSPTATVVKSKGCAFLEFTLATSLQAALRLHESEMQGRKINVELTAGGGGNSTARKAKIDESRKRLLTEREKTAANKRKREGEGESKDKSGKWKKEEPVEDKPKTVVVDGVVKKIRDRRIPKVDASGKEKERARKAVAKAARASSGANAIVIG